MNGYRKFYCANGKTYMGKEKCCLFCDHCTDIFYDYTNGPYMWLCNIQQDTEIGVQGLCKHFEEGEQNERS